jgi:hypothetical protein
MDMQPVSGLAVLCEAHDDLGGSIDLHDRHLVPSGFISRRRLHTIRTRLGRLRDAEAQRWDREQHGQNHEPFHAAPPACTLRICPA